jgi:hypothetical protein
MFQISTNFTIDNMYNINWMHPLLQFLYIYHILGGEANEKTKTRF